MVNVFPADNECGNGVDGSNPHASSSPTVSDEKSPSPAVSGHCSGKSAADMREEDDFYQKLNKINEPSGLSLLFNFRNTSIDLHEFYKIVIDRGGYHHVMKEGKWVEVAYFATRKEKSRLTPTQLQNLYAAILYPFEQTYFYRSPVKLNKKPNIIMPTTQVCTFEEKKPTRVEEKKPTRVKKIRKDPRAPLGSRNCYQMFLKMECDRLKSIHGGTPSAKLRDSIVEAWMNLSNEDKLPYIEASKKDKERYTKEMEAYEEQMKKEMVHIGRHRFRRSLRRSVCFYLPVLAAFPSPIVDVLLSFGWAYSRLPSHSLSNRFFHRLGFDFGFKKHLSCLQISLHPPNLTGDALQTTCSVAFLHNPVRNRGDIEDGFQSTACNCCTSTVCSSREANQCRGSTNSVTIYVWLEGLVGLLYTIRP
ncbi:unnamed protein product [Lactuca virosa]|uniref:ARID domain-containing protein n=1 Tax=Lactuca virosa TaxID=75947 RepID=A0AAU9MMX9_9ASTR|nr:unnamed protein product [Lactuca virosa]